MLVTYKSLLLFFRDIRLYSIVIAIRNMGNG